MEAADLNHNMKIPEKAVRESFSVPSDKGQAFSKELCGLQSHSYVTSLGFQSEIPIGKCETLPGFGKCPGTVERGCWISLIKSVPGLRKEVQISYLMAGRRIALPIMKCSFSRLDIGLSEIELSSWKASSPLLSWWVTWKKPRRTPECSRNLPSY